MELDEESSSKSLQACISSRLRFCFYAGSACSSFLFDLKELAFLYTGRSCVSFSLVQLDICFVRRACRLRDEILPFSIAFATGSFFGYVCALAIEFTSTSTLKATRFYGISASVKRRLRGLTFYSTWGSRSPASSEDSSRSTAFFKLMCLRGLTGYSILGSRSPASS